MKRYNQLHLSIMLLSMVAYVQAGDSVSTPTLGRLFKIMQLASKNIAPAAKTTPKTIQPSTPVTPSNQVTPANITPPTAPLQPLAPVSVSKSSAASSLGGASLVKLDYQVLQLPVTAQLSSVSIVADFGSTSANPVVFDATTFAALNSVVQNGHAVIVQVGTTTVDGNLIVYAALLDENDVSTMFGYAIQAAPAGVVETALSGFTVTYQFATATTTNTLSLTADQSLFILNPTVSMTDELSTLSVQAVFGASDAPVVSGPIALSAAMVQAINTALQKGDIINITVNPEYMFGLGDMVLTVVDTTSNTELGEVSGPITQAQITAGNFIGYQLNLGLQGKTGQSSFVRGANEIVALQVPTAVNQSLDYYVNADLSVLLADTEIVESVTINGTFSDGSSSSGFAFTATDLAAINQAIDNSDTVNIVVEQSANGSSLMAYAMDLTKATILATAVDQVTTAQESLTLDGFVVNYQLTGQTKPTSLAAQLGQSVNFATDLYANMPVLTSNNNCRIIFNGIFLEGGSGLKSGGQIQISSADAMTINAALNKQHEVVLGCGYSAFDQKLVLQAYDNIAKTVLVQSEQSSRLATTGIFVGYTLSVDTGNQDYVKVFQNIAGGNTLTLIPVDVTMPLATAITDSSQILNMRYRDAQGKGQPIQTVHILPDFGSTTTDADWISLDLSSVQQGGQQASFNIGQLNNAVQDLVAIDVSYQAPYIVISAWDMRNQQPIIAPIVVPVGTGTLQGVTLAYSFDGQTTIPNDQTVSVSGDSATIYMTGAVGQVRLRYPNADLSIPIPSAKVQLEQLWFSPLFKDGTFAELPLHAIAPQYMPMINNVLSENNGQLIFKSDISPTVVPNAQGFDMIVTAFVVPSRNQQVPEELFTAIFPLIQNNKNVLYTGAPWTSTNISYQFSGQANATVVGGLLPDQQLGISAPANVPQSVAELDALMTKNGAQLSVVNWVDANISGMPGFMNMNFNPRGGIMFWSNAWGSQYPLAPDISSIVSRGNWESGISIVVLGMDENNNIITNLSSVNPTSFYVAVYDASSGDALGGMSIPMSSFTDNGPTPNGAWTNSIGFGASGYSGFNNGSYPCVLTITNGTKAPTIPVFNPPVGPNLQANMTKILGSLEGNNPGITKYFTQRPVKTYVPTSNTVTAITIYTQVLNGQQGGGNFANFDDATTIAALQAIPAATWQEGVVFLPILLPANQYGPASGAFIADSTSLNQNVFGIMGVWLYDLNGNYLGNLVSNDNVWNIGYARLSIGFNDGDNTPWSTSSQPSADQVWIIQFTGAPTFNIQAA